MKDYFMIEYRHHTFDKKKKKMTKKEPNNIISHHICISMSYDVCQRIFQLKSSKTVSGHC